jgi:hypothetical protein
MLAHRLRVMNSAVLASVMVALAAGGCAGATSVGAPPTGRPAGTTTTAPHQLSATLTLDSDTVKTGGALAGAIAVENRTGHVLHASGCGGIFQVLLTSKTYHPGPIWPACLGPVNIPTGLSTYPMQVDARYNICGQGSGLTPCGTEGTASLPPGEYEATTFELGQVVPLPIPVAIRVTG